MKANARTVKFFDCKVRGTARDPDQGSLDFPPRPMLEVLQHMKAHLAVEKCHRKTRDQAETWHIADIDFNVQRTKAIVLVNRSDKAAADQAISNPVEDEFLVHTKVNEQGNAYSAHVAINLAEVRPQTYTCTVEDSVGISTKDIAALFALVMRAAADMNPDFYLCNDPSGDVALQRKLKYGFNFTGHPAPDFIQALNNGTLNGIELSDFRNQNNLFDDAGMTIEKKKLIHLKPTEKDASTWDRITSVSKTKGVDKLEKMRISFTDEDDFDRNVDINPQTLQLVNEFRFVRKARLTDFAARLNTGFEKANPELTQKMFALI